MSRKMGNSSSQVAQSQATTRDVSFTSQPPTQLTAPDATQDEGPRTLKRVASTMDASVEDTVRKAKRARMKASPRGQRKSVPQHTLGYSIQPSQEIPDTQEETQAGAGAEDGHAGGEDDEQAAAGVAPVSTEQTDYEGKQAKKTKGKKKRLHWNKDDAEPTLDIQGAQEAVEIDADNGQGETSLPKQKKRKRSDIELERLQKDVQDFAPDLESTPKPDLTMKRPDRAKNVDKHAAIAEGAASESETGAAELRDQSQQGGKKGKAGGKNPREPVRTSKKAAPKRMDASEEIQAVPEDGADTAEDQLDDNPSADIIPTPPESPDDPGQENVEPANDREMGSQSDADAEDGGDTALQPKKPSKAKNTKKRKQAAMTVDDPTGARDGAAVNDDASQSKRKTKRPKKISDPNDDDDHGAEYEPREDAGSDSGADEQGQARAAIGKPKKSKRRSKTSRDKAPTNTERGKLKGTWTKEERARADETFEDVVRVTAVPDYELKANIIDWKNPTPALRQFKEELFEAFPQRDFKSIVRFCQRRYNAFERGKWTPEQDELLREAFELWPDQWTAISDHVDRFWEDCRTRWRDVLSRPEKNAEIGPWSREEERRLAKAVRECRDLIVKESDDAEIREDPRKADAMISWKVVSDKLNNTRGVKRCREKWQRIKDLDLTADAAPSASKPISASRKRKSSRMQDIEDDFQVCEAGDVYDILCEIRFAIPDTTKVFEHETTFWSVVALKNPESRFKSSLRRRAFWAAIDQYPCKALRNATTLAAKAKAVKDRMDALHRQDEIELSRVYEGATTEKPKKSKTEKKEQKAKSGDGNSQEGTSSMTKKKAKKSKRPSEDTGTAGDKTIDGDTRETEQSAKKPKAKRAKKAAPKVESNGKFKSADRVVDSDDEDGAGSEDEDVQDASTHEDDHVESGAEPAGEDVERARQATEERSLDSRDPGLSPSTFMELCKGGQRKGTQKRRDGVKG